MDQVLMIADDLTGGLDAGIAFAAAGIPTCVGQNDYFLNSADARGCCVQVSVVPSRHMTREEAYRAVYDVVKQAMTQNFTCIFKKTDSALRGNVGAELEAVLAASGESELHFVPAFPRMKRVTRGGIQYIDGNIPVSQSVFASDPFNPVRHSAVAEVIAETSSVPTHPARERGEGVAIYDASTEADVLAAASRIFGGKAKLVAGCAGLAAALPRTLQLEKRVIRERNPSGRLIVFCGSINPISLRQCAWAEERGAPRFHLFQNGDFAGEDGLAARIAEAAQTHPITVFDTGSGDVDTRSMNAAESGRLVAEKVSRVIRGVSHRIKDATVFVIGGDTLIAFMDSLGIETIIPVEELFPGVVLAKYHFKGEWQYLISKSGGFGEPDLLEQISLKLSSPGEKAENGGEPSGK